MGKAIPDRRIDLSKLPRNCRGIDWENSIGYKLLFKYDIIEGVIEIIDHKAPYTKILYNGKEYSLNSSMIVNCNFGNILNYVNRDYLYNIGDNIKNENRDLIVVDRKKIKGNRFYKCKCNKCGFGGNNHFLLGKEVDEYLMLEYNLYARNINCPCCNNQIVVEHINDIPTTAPWMIKYFQDGYDEAKLYTKGSSRKIKPICPYCGEIKNRFVPINEIERNKSIGCVCYDGKSYPEKFIYNLLQQLGLNFINDVSKKWLLFKKFNSDETMKGRYDFVIENIKLLIEADGNFHNIDNPMSGMSYAEQQYIDQTKDKLAIEHGYKIIRIDCSYSDYEYIKTNILNSELSSLFNLTNIDWDKCEEFALRNIVKDVCDYKNNHPNITINELSKVFDLVHSTIRKYLHKGTKLGWCNYDGKEEKKKSIDKRSTRKMIPLYCVNTDSYYKNSYIASKNLNLIQSSVSRVISNGTLNLKGFKFNKITQVQYNQYYQEGRICYGDPFILDNTNSEEGSACIMN